MALIRVRDESGEYDWPEDALLDGMTPVDKYPPNPTAQPRPRKALLNLRVDGETVPGYDGLTLAALRALAKERDVVVDGKKNKPNFIAALVAADETSDVSASDAVEEPPTVTTPTAQADESANTSEE